MLAVLKFVLGFVVAAVGVGKMAEFAMWHAPSLERDIKLVIIAAITIVGGCVVISSYRELANK